MLDPVTQRYAEALFGLAQKTGALAEVSADVGRLALEREAPAAGGFFDARVPIDERREKMLALTRGMHEHTRHFVALVFDKRREEVLRGLGAAFHAKTLDDRGEAEGVVESARPLADTDLERLAASLGQRLGRRVSLSNRVVPEVVGGVRVIVGSQMIDASLRGRMDGLKKRLSQAPLPSLAEG